MSNLFNGSPAVTGAFRIEPHDSSHSPFFHMRKIMRAKPAKAAPALYTRSFAHPALQSIALFLVIVISMMAMVKPAHAAGAIAATVTYTIYHSSNQGKGSQ